MIGGMKRYLCTAIVVAVMLTDPAKAARDDLHRFATCAGRLSALMEHQWMFDGPGSEQTELLRAEMVALIDAIVLSDQRPQTLEWRLSAKHAHGVLLRRASFNPDPVDSAWAQQMADQLVRGCTGLLTSSWSS